MTSPSAVTAETLERRQLRIMGWATFGAGMIWIGVLLLSSSDPAALPQGRRDTFFSEDPQINRMCILASIAGVTGLGATGLLLGKRWGVSLAGIVTFGFTLLALSKVLKIVRGDGDVKQWLFLILYGWYPALDLALYLNLGRKASALRRASP